MGHYLRLFGDRLPGNGLIGVNLLAFSDRLRARRDFEAWVKLHDRRSQLLQHAPFVAGGGRVAILRGFKSSVHDRDRPRTVAGGSTNGRQLSRLSA